MAWSMGRNYLNYFNTSMSIEEFVSSYSTVSFMWFSYMQCGLRIKNNYGGELSVSKGYVKSSGQTV